MSISQNVTTLYNKKWNRKTMFCRLGYSYFQTERENDMKRLSGVKVKIRLLTWKNSQDKIYRPCTNTRIFLTYTYTHTPRMVLVSNFCSFIDDVVFLILIFDYRSIITCLFLNIIHLIPLSICPHADD